MSTRAPSPTNPWIWRSARGGVPGATSSSVSRTAPAMSRIESTRVPSRSKTTSLEAGTVVDVAERLHALAGVLVHGHHALVLVEGQPQGEPVKGAAARRGHEVAAARGPFLRVELGKGEG